jgi:hypothetical protein
LVTLAAAQVSHVLACKDLDEHGLGNLTPIYLYTTWPWPTSRIRKIYLLAWLHYYDPNPSIQVHHGDQEGVPGPVADHGHGPGGVGWVGSWQLDHKVLGDSWQLQNVLKWTMNALATFLAQKLATMALFM